MLTIRGNNRLLNRIEKKKFKELKGGRNMKLKKGFMLMTLLGAAMMAFAGCGSTSSSTMNQTTEGTISAESTTNEKDAVASASLSLPASVTFNEEGNAVVEHKYGTTVVPKDPQRVISIKMEDLLLALDIDFLAGRNFEGFYLEDEMNEKGIASLSVDEEANTVNYEEILSYQPDLIVIRDSFDQTVYDELNKIAPTIAFNLQDKVNSTLAIGAVFGIEDEAKARIEQYNEFLADANKKLQEAIGDETVAMLRILKNEIRLYPYSANEMSDFLYAEEGLGLQPDPIAVEYDTAENLAISMETLPDLKAENIILIAGYGSADQESVEAAKVRYDEIKADPLWKKVPAVQSGKVYEVDSRIWLNHGIICTEKKVQELVDLLTTNK